MRSVRYRILKSYKDTPHGPSDRIRTCGILLPKQARYQLRYTRLLSFLSGWAYSPKASALPTALHPDTVFTLHRKSVFDSPNSILDFGRKVNRPVAYPARIAYNKNITQYIKERAL